MLNREVSLVFRSCGSITILYCLKYQKGGKDKNSYSFPVFDSSGLDYDGVYTMRSCRRHKEKSSGSMMVPFFPQNLLVFFWTNPLKRSSAFDICLNAFEKDAPWWTRLFISSTFLLLFRQVILCCNNPLKFPWQFCVHSAEIINCNSSDKSQ